MSVLSIHILQFLLSFVLLMIDILKRVKWNISVMFICISLIAKDIDQFCKGLLSICLSSLDGSLFSSLASHLIGLFVFPKFSLLRSLFIQTINPLLVVSKVNFFSFCWLSLHSAVSFAVKKLFNFMTYHLPIIHLIS